jgi:uncharacterized protein (TIGR03086 family)
MPDPVVDYETAASGFAAVLARCGDDLSMPTPCEEWTVQDLVDHVMGGPPYYASAWGGQAPDVPEDADRATRYVAGYRALAETCRQPGVLEQMVPSPLGGGEMPAAVMFGILTSDTLIHTWDLARAIGADEALPAASVSACLTWLKGLPEAVLRSGRYAEAQLIDEQADPQTQLLAFAGRQP